MLDTVAAGAAGEGTAAALPAAVVAVALAEAAAGAADMAGWRRIEIDSRKCS
jgi:hypothetical protein